MRKKIFSIILTIFILSMNSVLAFDVDTNTSTDTPAVVSEDDNYIIEHLPDYKKTNTSIVKIMADSAVVLPNNVLQITFNSYFNSKNARKGDLVDFSLPNGLHTVEGRFLLPSGTKITGCILDIEKPKFFNRSAKVYMFFDKIILPNGNALPLTAYPADEKNALKVPKWKSAGKVGLYTLGFFGVGSGMGAWIGAASNSAGKGALAFGMPIGAGVGLIIGIVTPGLHYKAKCGKKIYIRLDDCLVIPMANISEEN